MRAHRHDEMPVDVEGWLSSPRVRRMTATERGLFWQLLCEAWADPDCSLPLEDEELRFLAMATEQEWAAGKGRVLAMFEERDGRLRNGKQVEVLRAQNARLAAAKANRERVAKWRTGVNGKEPEKEAKGRANPAKAPATAVELPRGFPKTEAEAIAACVPAGIPDDSVRSIWNLAMGRNGCDAKGVQISSFAHHAAAMWRFEQERHNRGKGVAGAEPQGKLSDAEILRRAMA